MSFINYLYMMSPGTSLTLCTPSRLTVFTTHSSPNKASATTSSVFVCNSWWLLPISCAKAIASSCKPSLHHINLKSLFDIIEHIHSTYTYRLILFINKTYSFYMILL